MKNCFLNSAAICLILLCVLLSLSDVNGQDINTPETVNDKKKAIHIQAFLGPFGKTYIPPEIIAEKENFPLFKDGQNLEADYYYFPSVYFLISAKPNINITKKDKRGDLIDYEFSKTGRDLEWMRVSIKLEPIFCSGIQLKNDSSLIKIVSVTPRETKESLVEQKPAQIASIGGSLVDTLMPFVPVKGTENITPELKALSGATNIVFKNLFSPKLEADTYAFIDNGREFGWYWKHNKTPDKLESLIGLRRTVGLLQVRRGIKGLKISFRVHAKWSSDLSKEIDDEYVDADTIPYTSLGEKDETIIFDDSFCKIPPAPKNIYERTDYTFLENLDGFPLVIPKEVVCKILQKTDSQCTNWNPQQDFKELKIITSEGKSYLLREELKKVLGLK